MRRMITTVLMWVAAATSAQAEPVQDWINAQSPDHRWVLEEIMADERFTQLAQLCPADVFPASRGTARGSTDCTKNPGWCLAKCRLGQGKACFGVARAIQTEMEDEGEATFTFPMFMAACAAGHANGCTNAGAAAKNGSWINGTWPEGVASRPCQFRTYEAACTARAEWGCYMLGLEWGREGVNGRTDLQKARKAWRKSCQIDPDGSACAASRRQLSPD